MRSLCLILALLSQAPALRAACLDAKVYRFEFVRTVTNTFPSGQDFNLSPQGITLDANGYFVTEAGSVSFRGSGTRGGFVCPAGQACTITKVWRLSDLCGRSTDITLTGSLGPSFVNQGIPPRAVPVATAGLDCSVPIGCPAGPCVDCGHSNIARYGFNEFCSACSRFYVFSHPLPAGACATPASLPTRTVTLPTVDF